MAHGRISRRTFLGLAASASASAAVVGSAPTVAARPRRTKQPRHFLLVHGAWHGAWCWYKIIAGLEAVGHTVTAIDLPSAGIDGTAPASVKLQTQADRIVATLDALSDPVILVGHSAGGPSISMAADARPAKIQKLVYLTAFLLPSGTSVTSVAIQDKGSLLNAHLEFGAGTLDVAPAARAEIFYNECDAQDVALAGTLFKPVGLSTVADPVVVGAGFAGVRRFYISCLQDHAISPDTQHAMYTALPCEKVLSIRSDHSSFFSRPSALLRALGTIARA